MTEILVRGTVPVATHLLHQQGRTLRLSWNTQTLNKSCDINLNSKPRILYHLSVFTLESPVVSHIEVREAGGEDVGAILVPL